MEKAAFEYKPFNPSISDPLASEHAAVMRWVEDAFRENGENNWWRHIELKSIPSGQELLNAKPPQARLIILAGLVQACHWDGEMTHVCEQGENEFQRMNAHLLPGWSETRGRWIHVTTLVSTLLKRALPLAESDLISLIKWCGTWGRYSSDMTLLRSIARAAQRHAEANSVTFELRQALRLFGTQLRDCRDKDTVRMGTMVEQLCVAGQADQAALSTSADNVRPVQRAPAGNPAVLYELKKILDLADDGSSTIEIGPDHFHLRADSPLQYEH